MSSSIRIVDAKTHNLKGVDLEIPHQKLTVITGVSGSGKSSLAIDTLYAEGQRQYIESLSTYARQFLNQLQRPDVEQIDGLQPTLCIDQKVGAVNPRSTVATITEVYDYLRLLMARVGQVSCYACGSEIAQQSDQEIVSELAKLPERTKVVLMAPVVRGRRGSHRDELQAIRKAGLIRVRVDGEMLDIDEVGELAQRKNHTIEAVVDRLIVRDGCEERLVESVALALRLAGGLLTASIAVPAEAGGAVNSQTAEWQERLFSTQYACPDCGVSYEELEPRTFSFNSPYGACPECQGVGLLYQVDPDRLVDWELSGKSGAFGWADECDAGLKRQVLKEVRNCLSRHGVAWGQPLGELSKKKRSELLHGKENADGLVETLQEFVSFLEEEDEHQFDGIQEALQCNVCEGARLRKEALAVRVEGRNIWDIASDSIANVNDWFQSIQFPESKQPIANPILSEMRHRLEFLNKVG
ncbi:MAG: ABC-ATPase UvrA, partial [Planctomycetota bacterium]